MKNERKSWLGRMTDLLEVTVLAAWDEVNNTTQSLHCHITRLLLFWILLHLPTGVDKNPYMYNLQKFEQ